MTSKVQNLNYSFFDFFIISLLASLIGFLNSITMCNTVCSLISTKPLTIKWKHALLLTVALNSIIRPIPLLIIVVASLILTAPKKYRLKQVGREVVYLIALVYGLISIGLFSYTFPLFLSVKLFVRHYFIFSLIYSAFMFIAVILAIAVSIRIIKKRGNSYLHSWSKIFVSTIAILFIALVFRIVTEIVLQPISITLYHCHCSTPRNFFVPITTSPRKSIADVSIASLIASWIYALTLLSLLALEGKETKE